MRESYASVIKHRWIYKTHAYLYTGAEWKSILDTLKEELLPEYKNRNGHLKLHWEVAKLGLIFITESKLEVPLPYDVKKEVEEFKIIVEKLLGVLTPGESSLSDEFIFTANETLEGLFLSEFEIPTPAHRGKISDNFYIVTCNGNEPYNLDTLFKDLIPRLQMTKFLAEKIIEIKWKKRPEKTFLRNYIRDMADIYKAYTGKPIGRSNILQEFVKKSIEPIHHKNKLHIMGSIDNYLKEITENKRKRPSDT